MPPPAEYNFDYSIIVCIDANGRLQVFWANTSEGNDASDRIHELVIEKDNWDGSAIEGVLNPADSRCQDQEVTLTATSTGNAPDGSTIVDVDYVSTCTNRPSASGTHTVIVNTGAECPLPE